MRPGYYWFRRDPDTLPIVVLVWRHQVDGMLMFKGDLYNSVTILGEVSDYPEAVWAGPLEPPEKWEVSR